MTESNTTVINDKLLSIIESGINTIILNLKTVTTSHDNTENIKETLEVISKTIETSQINEIRDVSDLAVLDEIKSKLQNKEKPKINKNLDDATDTEDTIIFENIILTGTDHKKKIEKRLQNCQKLEMLYLIKHNELITTFKFAIDLFNKYKYSTNVILYLLKNLSQDGGPGSTVKLDSKDSADSIRIPKVLITDITKLINDQVKIAEVINTMKTQIESPELKNIDVELQKIPRII